MSIELINAQDQHKLNGLKIAIRRNNFPAEILVANLIGLGVRDIGLFGKREDRVLDDKFLQKNNNYLDLYFEDYGEDYDFNVFGEGCDFSIKHTGIIGGIEGAIIADEIRKKYAPIAKFDLVLKTPVRYDVKDVLPRSILAIGAGGIGNYFCLGAKYLGHNVRLVDFDLFEQTNANRQIFCREGKPKVRVIEEQLDCVEGIERRFDSELIKDFNQEGYLPEVVVGCVDNVSTRNLIREYALNLGIPYFDGGVDTTFGKIKLNPEIREIPVAVQTKTNSSCLYKPNPSIVIPNCIVGLKLAEIAGVNCSKYEFNFDSRMDERIREEIE